MRKEIDPVTFAINIYQDGEILPFHYQPDYPNGDKFDSVDEASAWADAAIAAHSPECLVYAPNGKNIQGETKPDPKAREKLLAKLGITEEEVRVLMRG
jgi:hypothetical protein